MKDLTEPQLRVLWRIANLFRTDQTVDIALSINCGGVRGFTETVNHKAQDLPQAGSERELFERLART